MVTAIDRHEVQRLVAEDDAQLVDVLPDHEYAQDVPTCGPHELLGEVRRRTFDAGWDECIVIDCNRLVVGRLRGRAWEEEGESLTAGEIMELGPTTVRPHSLLQPFVERMTERGIKLVVVTTPQGELLGVLTRSEAEHLLSGEPPEEIWRGCEGCPGQWQVW